MDGTATIAGTAAAAGAGPRRRRRNYSRRYWWFVVPCGAVVLAFLIIGWNTVGAAV